MSSVIALDLLLIDIKREISFIGTAVTLLEYIVERPLHACNFKKQKGVKYISKYNHL